MRIVDVVDPTVVARDNPKGKNVRVVRLNGHTFIRSLIQPGSTVIDCGANQGQFSAWFAQNVGCTVHGFEPDPRLFPTLPRLPGVTFHNTAVMRQSGVMSLSLGDRRCSTGFYRDSDHQQTVEVPAISLDDFSVQMRLARIDLLKMDIEGAELSVVESMSKALLQRIMQITIEFHDFINSGDIPIVRTCLKRLREEGFWILKVSRSDYSDVCCVNTALVPLSPLQRLRLVVEGRYVAGLTRLMRRELGLAR